MAEKLQKYVTLSLWSLLYRQLVHSVLSESTTCQMKLDLCVQIVITAVGSKTLPVSSTINNVKSTLGFKL